MEEYIRDYQNDYTKTKFLDNITEIVAADDFKNKFSIIHINIRSVEKILTNLKPKLANSLDVPDFTKQNDGSLVYLKEDISVSSYKIVDFNAFSFITLNFKL